MANLSPLKDMPLEEIRLTAKNITTQGLDILRNMKSLKTIGTDWNQVWPAAEFWARYQKGTLRSGVADVPDCCPCSPHGNGLPSALLVRGRPAPSLGGPDG